MSSVRSKPSVYFTFKLCLEQMSSFQGDQNQSVFLLVLYLRFQFSVSEKMHLVWCLPGFYRQVLVCSTMTLYLMLLIFPWLFISLKTQVSFKCCMHTGLIELGTFNTTTWRNPVCLQLNWPTIKNCSLTLNPHFHFRWGYDLVTLFLLPALFFLTAAIVPFHL